MNAILAVVILAAALYLPWLGARELWSPDEPRYAQVAVEMIRDGHWWHPYVNGRPYLDKPPLYFWAEGLLSLPGGEVTAWTARLPSVLAGLLLVAVTFDLGRRQSGPVAAAIAAAVLATAWLVAWMARRVNLDVPLTACSTAAVWCGWRAGEAARRAGVGTSVLTWAAGCGICVALGMMLKGPVVLLPVLAPGLVLLAHPGARRDRPSRLVPTVAAAAVIGCAAILAAWLLPAAKLGGYDVFGAAREHVVERASRGLHHVQPPWYYLLSLPVDLLPWSFLALPALWAAWRRRSDPVDATLLGWVTIPLVVLSIVVEKRNLYVLPLFPPLALSIGRWVAALAGSMPRAYRVGAGAVTVMLVLLAVALSATAAFGRHVESAAEYLALPGASGRVWLLAGSTALGAIVALWAASRRDPRREMLALALAFGLVELGIFGFLPVLDPVKSARGMGETIARETGEAPLASFPVLREGFVYYSGRFMDRVETDDELRDWLASHPRPVFVLTFERDRHRVAEAGGQEPIEIGRDPVGHREAVLLKLR